MAAAKSEGNCYICGKTLGKTAMKNHILKEHALGPEECYLLKIEGAYDKQYWLYADIPLTAKLEDLDEFLRLIWLECCGHLSVFRIPGYRPEIDYFSDEGFEAGSGKDFKIKEFSPGDTIVHEYDMGSTTECKITFVAKTYREKQREKVRLLARNVPESFECVVCGKPAVYVCQECYDESAVFCKKCMNKHEHEYMFKITNSPRCGVCGYDGELDKFTFNPKKFA